MKLLSSNKCILSPDPNLDLTLSRNLSNDRANLVLQSMRPKILSLILTLTPTLTPRHEEAQNRDQNYLIKQLEHR